MCSMKISQVLQKSPTQWGAWGFELLSDKVLSHQGRAVVETPRAQRVAHRVELRVGALALGEEVGSERAHQQRHAQIHLASTIVCGVLCSITRKSFEDKDRRGGGGGGRKRQNTP
jgi:hypothetical protein